MEKKALQQRFKGSEGARFVGVWRKVFPVGARCPDGGIRPSVSRLPDPRHHGQTQGLCLPPTAPVFLRKRLCLPIWPLPLGALQSLLRVCRDAVADKGVSREQKAELSWVGVTVLDG